MASSPPSLSHSPHEYIPDSYLDQLKKTTPRPVSLDVGPSGLLGDLETRNTILVYAFGAFDRYYICWQDRNGAYRQERHGLPPALDRWLFPPDGSSRDLATLQVSLGHNDEFFAFDQYERISHINTELRGNASSARSQSPPGTMANISARMASRRKSHTFSHADEARDNERQQQRQRMKKKVRPWSIAIAGVVPLRPSRENNKSQQDRPSAVVLPPGSSGAKGHEPAPMPVVPMPAQRPMYSDAGVQTDSDMDMDMDMADSGDRHDNNCFHGCGSDQDGENASLCARDRIVEQTSAERLESTYLPQPGNSSKCLESTYSPQRASNFSKPLEPTDSPHPNNPITMGLMSRYFRQKHYRLGDALVRASTIAVGVGVGVAVS